jgi:hypothetical protein
MNIEDALKKKLFVDFIMDSPPPPPPQKLAHNVGDRFVLD